MSYPNSISSIIILVFSCVDLGIDVANTLQDLPCVDSVTLVNAPYQRKEPNISDKIRNTYKYEGLSGFLSAALSRLRRIHLQG
jgi:hypothetical protein